jgi:putative ABC transport system substrate-binding protein
MDRWSRRQFVQGAGAVGLALLTGCGRWPGQEQVPAPRMYRLGYLGGPTLPEPFRDGLRELGYVEGQNLLVAVRDAGVRPDSYAVLAAELVAWHPDVLVTPGTGTGRGARDATSTIPIVVLGQAGDLLASGLADSLARPGGNVTGLTAVNQSLAAKRLQLLKETAPTITRLAVLRYALDSAPSGTGMYTDTTAGSLGVQLQPVAVRSPDELERALEAILQEHAEALLVITSPLTLAARARIVDFAAQSRLPAAYEVLGFVQAGGLMAYMPRSADAYRRAAGYVDRILKGANPAELPIEQPMLFDFAINLKTAQALGLTIPEHVLLQATEVIQ